MPDSIYNLTRRKGIQVTVVQVISTTVNDATGKRTLNTDVENVRLAVKEPTAYSRLIGAKAVQRDIGRTTFIFWVRDVPFDRLDVKDYIMVGLERYDVITSEVFETALVITANVLDNATGKQEMSVSIGNTVGMQGTAGESVA